MLCLEMFDVKDQLLQYFSKILGGTMKTKIFVSVLESEFVTDGQEHY